MRVTSPSFLLGVLLLASACDDDDYGGPSSDARLRFVHGAPGTAAVNLRIDGQNVLTGVSYANATAPYQEVDAGSRTIAARLAGATTDLATRTSTLASNVSYTALLGKKQTTTSIVVLTDDVGAPAAGKAELRVINFAPSQSDLDVYVTAPDADITSATPNAAAVSYEEASANLELAPGTFRVRVTTAGTKTVVLNVHPVTLTAGQVRTMIALDAAAGGTPLTSIMLADRN